MTIISNAVSGRISRLLGSDYKVVPFKELEVPYQLAIGHYMAIDGEAWSAAIPEGADWPTRKQQLRGLRRCLPKMQQLYGNVLFGVALLPSEKVRTAIMNDPEISMNHSSWEAYHDWYSITGDLPKHRKSNRWPVILSSDDDETLLDGWHRLHCYMRRGDDTVPAVFFPTENQYQNRMNHPA